MRRKRLIGRLGTALVVTAATAGGTFAVVASTTPLAIASPASPCGLANGITHVVNLTFDNVHFTRDTPNVPSDLEQMPNLLNFIKENGTLLSNHHTPLIAHTATDILTTYTGVYGDKHGIPVSNSFGTFNQDGTTQGASSFAYWTDPLSVFNNGTVAAASSGIDVATLTGAQSITLTSVSFTPAAPADQLIQTTTGYARVHYTGLDKVAKQITGVSLVSGTGVLFTGAGLYPVGIDTTPQMVGQDGKTFAAPWAPYTEAGCNVGNVATANMVMENNTSDIVKVFGPTSPEAADPNSFNDFVGIGIHCAKNTACAANGNAKPDLLPDQPGGYTGFNALYGHKYTAPFIGGTGTAHLTLNDVYNGATPPAGIAAQTMTGFPGFDGMNAAVSLGYVADMLEHGVPVTYAYLSDAHDKHTAPTGAYGPGEAGYVQALHQYDAAFGAFFNRLKADGITSKNTLFVVSSDENDHVAAAAATVPANCDGINVSCLYKHGVFTAPASDATGAQLGEIAVNIKALLAGTASAATRFFLHSDSAPNFYVQASGGGSPPVQGSDVVRQLERDVSTRTITNPYTGAVEAVANYLAGQTEEKLLHLTSADPARNPTFTAFAKPADFVTTGNCPGGASVCSNSAFAYIHGDFAPEINTTWLGLAGPGVANNDVDAETWTDHTDVRPTVLSLVGLKDPYVHDGRVIIEDLTKLPPALAHDPTGGDLGVVLKQLDASVGAFAADTLKASTVALTSTSANDATYNQLEGQLAGLGAHRDAVAADILALLDGASFSGRRINPRHAEADIEAARCILGQAHALGQGQSIATGCNSR